MIFSESGFFQGMSVQIGTMIVHRVCSVQGKCDLNFILANKKYVNFLSDRYRIFYKLKSLKTFVPDVFRKQLHLWDSGIKISAKFCKCNNLAIFQLNILFQKYERNTSCFQPKEFLTLILSKNCQLNILYTFPTSGRRGPYVVFLPLAFADFSKLHDYKSGQGDKLYCCVIRKCCYLRSAVNRRYNIGPNALPLEELQL